MEIYAKKNHKYLDPNLNGQISDLVENTEDEKGESIGQITHLLGKERKIKLYTKQSIFI